VSEINVNGEIQKDTNLFAGKNHRGLKYGDGLFESIRMMKGKMPLLNDHLRRLFRGMKFLKIKKPSHFNTAFFRKEILRITKQEQNARIRISVFRSVGGLYVPTNNQPSFLIEYQRLKLDNWLWNKKGLTLKICPTVQLPITPWSGLKTSNSLPYILASLWKQKEGVDDCILLNQLGFVAEASSSNVFYFKKNQLYTTTDLAGGILGVMRGQILKLARKKGMKIHEKNFLPKDLMEADEVFLTNAIQGIRWVRELEGVEFSNGKTKKIWDLIV